MNEDTPTTSFIKKEYTDYLQKALNALMSIAESQRPEISPEKLIVLEAGFLICHSSGVEVYLHNFSNGHSRRAKFKDEFLRKFIPEKEITDGRPVVLITENGEKGMKALIALASGPPKHYIKLREDFDYDRFKAS